MLVVVVVQSLSCVQFFVIKWTAAYQAPLSSNSCSLSLWCCVTNSSSAALFSFCLQSCPASRSFPMSQLCPSGGQSIGPSASVFPVNIQDWFPLELTGLISLLSKGLFKSLLQHHSLASPFFGIEVKMVLFQYYGHCRVFQICWHIECRTFRASSLRIWNSWTGIPSPPLALCVVMLPKVHLTSHSRITQSLKGTK